MYVHTYQRGRFNTDTPICRIPLKHDTVRLLSSGARYFVHTLIVAKALTLCKKIVQDNYVHIWGFLDSTIYLCISGRNYVELCVLGNMG